LNQNWFVFLDKLLLYPLLHPTNNKDHWVTDLWCFHAEEGIFCLDATIKMSILQFTWLILNYVQYALSCLYLLRKPSNLTINNIFSPSDTSSFCTFRVTESLLGVFFSSKRWYINRINRPSCSNYYKTELATVLLLTI